MSSQSHSLYERACRVMPGGVNSPVRAFGGVGGGPVFIDRALGSCMTTADGVELLDFCGSWGPLLLGHAHPQVVAAVAAAAARGTSYGACTRGEVELAELLCARIPYVDRVRLVNSGTEAVMTALRLARGVTGRSRILKFEGCYHGHSDHVLASAGSGLLTNAVVTPSGVSAATAAELLLAPYNDLGAVRQVTDRHGDELAALIVEPVAGNMGLVAPEAGFLEGLREEADHCGAMLIFDEVITGFRLAPATFGSICGVTPDLTCLGKIIGGGLPIGAVAGPAEIMSELTPEGDVYQAGTLSGNPLAVAAGLATLRTAVDENPYPHLTELGRKLSEGMNSLATASDVKLTCTQLGGMFTVFFRRPPIRNLRDAKGASEKSFAQFFHGMLDRGIYLSPSQYELDFISGAHTESEIDRFLATAGEVVSHLA